MTIKCIKCGGEIHPGRLKALPNTRVCVECSNVGTKRAIHTTGGNGDHTWNDIQVVSEDDYYSHQAYEQSISDTISELKNATNPD